MALSVIEAIDRAVALLETQAVDNEEQDRLVDMATNFELAAIRTPAKTLDEVVAKARLAYRISIGQQSSREPLGVLEIPYPGYSGDMPIAALDDTILLWRIIKDLERVAGEA